MIKTGLPAALVKSLYLFVALPPRKESSDSSPKDVEEDIKCSFQDTLIQVFTLLHVLFNVAKQMHHYVMYYVMLMLCSAHHFGILENEDIIMELSHLKIIDCIMWHATEFGKF